CDSLCTRSPPCATCTPSLRFSRRLSRCKEIARSSASQSKTMERKTRIAVVGAGLGGMTVAGFLQRAGFSAMVYEQAPSFSRIGAGIILTSNATKGLRRLGVEQMLVDTGIKADCYISRAWDSGKTIYEIWFDAASEVRFGGPYVNIHRGDLHAVIHSVVM